MNPPAYFLGGLLAVVVLALTVPAGAVSNLVFELVGVALIALGIGLNVRGSSQFHQAGTPIRPGSRGGTLVVEGVFRYSRNPMYLGLAFILLGAALALGSAPALLVTPLFVGVIDRGFVAMEEAILEEEFGDAYRRYRERVRRWI